MFRALLWGCPTPGTPKATWGSTRVATQDLGPQQEARWNLIGPARESRALDRLGVMGLQSVFRQESVALELGGHGWTGGEVMGDCGRDSELMCCPLAHAGSLAHQTPPRTSCVGGWRARAGVSHSYHLCQSVWGGAGVACVCSCACASLFVNANHMRSWKLDTFGRIAHMPLIVSPSCSRRGPTCAQQVAAQPPPASRSSTGGGWAAVRPRPPALCANARAHEEDARGDPRRPGLGGRGAPAAMYGGAPPERLLRKRARTRRRGGPVGGSHREMGSLREPTIRDGAGLGRRRVVSCGVDWKSIGGSPASAAKCGLGGARSVSPKFAFGAQTRASYIGIVLAAYRY